jgi:V-ATPase subunit C
MDQQLKSRLQELVSIDNDVKSKFSQYNTVKTNLTTLQRRQTCVFGPLVVILNGDANFQKAGTCLPNLLPQSSTLRC